jgi:hypothetical protein
MAKGRSVVAERRIWVLLVGLVALAFWVVALGVGLRAWFVLGPQPGLVGHVSAFGDAAAPWMIVASVLTLTTALLGIGHAIVRHLVDGPVVTQETLPERKPLPERTVEPRQDTLAGDPEGGATASGDDV